MYWWGIFLSASMIDLLSTYVVFYVRSVSWGAEFNIVVMSLGPLMGHAVVLIGLNIIALIVLYIIASMVRTQKYHKFFAWFFCIASGVRLGAAVCNLFLST